MKSSIKEESKLLSEDDAYEACRKVTVESNDLSCSTICQGSLLLSNLWFKRDDTGTPVEVRALDWQNVRCASNCVDLVPLLAQCNSETWPELFKCYAEAVRSEHPIVTDEQLREGLNTAGLQYALLILSGDKDIARLADISVRL